MEWRGKRLDFRTSLEDESLGRAIAVAGLYELEELITEIHEDDPMIDPYIAEGSSPQNATSTVTNTKDADETSKKESGFQAQLLIELSVSGKKGLLAKPQWITKSGLIPACGSRKKDFDDHFDGSSLIQFTRESIEDGFQYDKENGIFWLSDWDKVGKFALERLRHWEDSFELKYLGEAALIKRGRNEIHWELEAQSKGSEKMLLKDQFRLGKNKLNTRFTRKISKIGTGTIFLQSQGLVRLKKDQIDDYEWWKQSRGKNETTDWPRYMLFSLFARKHLRTKADGTLEKWQAEIQSVKHPTPTKRIKFLRSYQKEGVGKLLWLHQLGCHGLLADEMGLGKTMQALALIASSPRLELPDLVVCPASVVPVWEQEVATHFPKIKVEVLKQGNDFTKHSKECLWVASYTQIRRHRSLLEGQQFRCAILDEAQMIKNPQAKVTQACLAINARYRLALSGTPLENSAMDVWTIFRFLMPGLLGGRREMEKELLKDSSKAHVMIKRQIAPFIVRRLKKDVAKELPPKIEAEVPCILNQEQRKVYKLLVEQGILANGENLQDAVKNSPTHIFSLLTRLRQSCCDLRLLPNPKEILETGAKEAILLQKLNDLAHNGSKAIIFSQFTSYLSILEKNLRTQIPKLKIVKLTGATRDRTQPVKTFQESKDSTVMLASLKAAGLGVTLTSADYIFLMDPWWNPAIEEQAIDRAHRIGRTKPIFIYRLIAKGTIEEKVREFQKEKKDTFEEIVGDIEKPTRLLEHFKDLEDLIKLENF
jgi:SNF2 family DNA or RNA helicase